MCLLGFVNACFTPNRYVTYSFWSQMTVVTQLRVWPQAACHRGSSFCFLLVVMSVAFDFCWSSACCRRLVSLSEDLRVRSPVFASVVVAGRSRVEADTMRALARGVRKNDDSGPAGGSSVPFTSYTLGDISLHPVWLGLICQPTLRSAISTICVQGASRPAETRDR